MDIFKKKVFYFLFFLNISISLKTNFNSLNPFIFNTQFTNLIISHKNTKNIFLQNSIPKNLCSEIKKFLSPLELNLTIDNKRINMFKNSSKEPPLFFLKGILLSLLTMDSRYGIFNTFNFRSIAPSFFYLNP